MWSDRTPPEQLQTLVAGLRSVLPGPSAAASGITTSLGGQASVEQVAELLRFEPGFAWLNTRLLHHPLATISYSDGCAIVTGPEGTLNLIGRGFDILQAMLEAWRGPSEALLAGFISYDLAAEIEDLGSAPAEDFSFPRFYFGLFDSALMFDGETWKLSATDAWRPIQADAAQDLIQRAKSKPLPVAAARNAAGELSSRPDRRTFEAAVERIVATI